MIAYDKCGSFPEIRDIIKNVQIGNNKHETIKARI
jgi:hypothetical protein